MPKPTFDRLTDGPLYTRADLDSIKKTLPKKSLRRGLLTQGGWEGRIVLAGVDCLLTMKNPKTLKGDLETGVDLIRRLKRWADRGGCLTAERARVLDAWETETKRRMPEPGGAKGGKPKGDRIVPARWEWLTRVLLFFREEYKEPVPRFQLIPIVRPGEPTALPWKFVFPPSMPHRRPRFVRACLAPIERRLGRKLFPSDKDPTIHSDPSLAKEIQRVWLALPVE